MLYKHLVHPLEEKLYHFTGESWVLIDEQDFMSVGISIAERIEGFESVSTTELKDDWTEHIYYDPRVPTKGDT